jgi:hypothetical protein
MATHSLPCPFPDSPPRPLLRVNGSYSPSDLSCCDLRLPLPRFASGSSLSLSLSFSPIADWSQCEDAAAAQAVIMEGTQLKVLPLLQFFLFNENDP